MTTTIHRGEAHSPRSIRRDQTAAGTMLSPAYIVLQPKGGTGKSTVVEQILLHLYHSVEKQIWLIDADLSNPDLYRAHYGSEIKCECVALDSDAGYTTVARRLSDPRIDGPIAISTGAGLAEVYARNLGILDLAAHHAHRSLNVAITIDLDTDSVIHIQSLREAMPHSVFYVVRPRHFGRPEEFEVFNESDFGQEFLAAKRVIDLPVMPSALARRFKTDRKSLISIMQSDDIADRCTLETWAPHSRRALSPLLDW
ncbi:hypothetical protein [Bosea sp. (in: a-proteobacteria)]|uniref:hypothetical protein n=1 Tax=Bosea sp. (in: a-proteobacteria) TaxID=1871050 RepID=UPI003B3AC411